MFSFYHDFDWSIVKIIEWLNEKEGTDKYRLPSEAEWEYACRAGTTTRYSFNSDGKTHPVGQKEPNLWGLYDMLGNVWEWVQDSGHDDYNGAPTDGSAWGGDGAGRVVRGSSWRYFAEVRQSAIPVWDNRGDHYDSLGFRLLQEL